MDLVCGLIGLSLLMFGIGFVACIKLHRFAASTSQDDDFGTVLLILDYRASSTNSKFSLYEEIEQASGGSFRDRLKPGLQQLLNRMLEERLIQRQVSVRGLAQTQNSDAPVEYGVAQAGHEFLRRGRPKSGPPAVRPPPSNGLGT